MGHSFSPAYFARKFKALGLDADYVKFELPTLNDLPRIINEHPELRGFNVTIPHKQAVMQYLDNISAEARAIGAVNCVRVSRNADRDLRLTGCNTDITGFKNSLRPLLRPCHEKALVLGTGGASKAVVHGLGQLGIKIRYVSRTKRDGMYTYDEITPAIINENLLIVNCTPCGMSPHTDECPQIPYEALTSKHLLFDLIYNPEETLFLRKGRERGAVTKNGLEMLYGQAEAGWDFWHEAD